MIAYLDNAATTPVSPEAAQAACNAMTTDFGNPSTQYPLGGGPENGLRSGTEPTGQSAAFSEACQNGTA